MVRKRSKGAKRLVESDEEPETESDFEDDPIIKPETKKYSLRQRKKPTFNSDDYEYEEDLFDVPRHKPPSDDEDFEVNNKKRQSSKVKEAADSENLEENVDQEANESPKPSDNEQTAETQDELVDFEDMIRADIVMNKNRIDYDNVIQKTEIKIQPLPEGEIPVETKKKPKPPQPIIKPKGRRGRKPKRRNSDIEEPQFLAPQIQDNENDEDYHPYKPKRTRKPKTRPAGEIDSSILDDYEDYEFEDHNDADYNPNDDIEYPGLSGLSSYILDKQISVDFENNLDDKSLITKEPESSAEDNSNSLIVNSSTCEKVPDLSVSITGIESSSKETSSTELIPQTSLQESDSTSALTEDTTTVPTSTTDSAQKENSDTAQTDSTDDINNDEVFNDDAPRQLNEKSGTFEKIMSTSNESVVQNNETVENGDLYVNGSANYIESAKVNIIDCKEEEEEDEEDDDIVFIEDKKCEVIVLDD